MNRKTLISFPFLCAVVFAKTLSAQELLEIGYTFNGNIFEDSFSYADSIYKAAVTSRNRQRIAKTSIIRYDITAAYQSYSKYTTESNIRGALDAGFEKELGLFSFSLKSYAEYLNYPNAGTYNYLFLSAQPGILWFPFEDTSVGLHYIYDNMVYPKYNLDYEGASGVELKLSQDIAALTTLEITAQKTKKLYPERFVYDSTSTATNEKRYDDDLAGGLSLGRNFGKDIFVYVGHRHSQTDSNANEVAFDSSVSQSSNTLIGDYYDLAAQKTSLGITAYLDEKTTVGGNLSYETITYDGQTARNLDGALLKTQKREDKKIGGDLKLRYDFFSDEESNSAWVLEINYAFAKNDTNDLYYKATSNAFGAKLLYYF